MTRILSYGVGVAWHVLRGVADDRNVSTFTLTREDLHLHDELCISYHAHLHLAVIIIFLSLDHLQCFLSCLIDSLIVG